ncbi:MAG: SDR family oxidoreductase [Bacteroidota bacterium]|nr:SDR family oxidoreductase [Bacteroidota bacterium]
MRVLLTGGAGYIGTELIYQLIRDKTVEEIIVYDNLIRGNYNLFLGKTKLETPRVTFIKGELLDTRKLKQLVDRSDVVYHLAAKVTTPFADHNPHEFDQVNHWGTAELTYLLEESNVKRFIYLSSVSVYGSSDEEVSILSVPQPRTFYGISKYNAERHVGRLLEKGMEVYILRSGNVYGYSKSMRFDSVINKFIFEANFNRKIKIYGDGEQHRAFLHVDRLSQFLGKLLHQGLSPDTYNLVEDNLSINQIADELNLLYPDLEMVYVNQDIRMRNLMVKPDDRLEDFFHFQRGQLGTDLKRFRERFTF